MATPKSNLVMISLGCELGGGSVVAADNVTCGPQSILLGAEEVIE
jgi:hypothetical protein